MLTRIEIDGFKTFKDFKVELAPFQVIVGPNGSGKSNLFDALQLLSRFASNDLRSAFQDMRGDADDLFTLLPGGKHVDKIRLAVEMLVDKKVLDDLGQRADLKYTRLRYELEVTFIPDEYGLERPLILHEQLKSIPQETDGWCKKYGLTVQNGWLPETTGRQAEFIITIWPLFLIHLPNNHWALQRKHLCSNYSVRSRNKDTCSAGRMSNELY